MKFLTKEDKKQAYLLENSIDQYFASFIGLSAKTALKKLYSSRKFWNLDYNEENNSYEFSSIRNGKAVFYLTKSDRIEKVVRLDGICFY